MAMRDSPDSTCLLVFESTSLATVRWWSFSEAMTQTSSPGRWMAKRQSWISCFLIRQFNFTVCVFFGGVIFSTWLLSQFGCGLLNLCFPAFVLRILEMDDGFLNDDAEHQHDERVSSCGFHVKGEVNQQKLNEWLGWILKAKGADLFRTKGVLAVQGMKEKFVFQVGFKKKVDMMCWIYADNERYVFF